MFFLAGGQNGLPGYQGDLDMTGSENERTSTSRTSLVTNDESNSNEATCTQEIENKRKEMIHDLLNTASKLFKFSLGDEGHPNSPRSIVDENNDVDKLKQLFRFQCFVEYCLVHTKQKKEWKIRRSNEKVSDVFTCADEAFAFLTLENNCNDWLMIVDGKVPGGGQGANKVARKYSKSVYTTWGATKKDGVTNKHLQWTMKGIQRYNELYRMVKKERETTESIELEEELRVNYERMEGSVSNEMVEECDYENIMEEYEQPICEF